MEPRICVVGLGYVGLPLATAFGAILATIGFDLKTERIQQLQAGLDVTRETGPAALAAATGLRFTCDPSDIAAADVYIVTVPTPVDRHRRPDFSHLVAASRTVATALRPGNTVIYESTVYPGATEEVCVPILERHSGLACNVDFTVGYSPERIKPGDEEHRLATICKVTSGSTPAAAEFIDSLYRRIVPAGTHMAPAIPVAEAIWAWAACLAVQATHPPTLLLAPAGPRAERTS